MENVVSTVANPSGDFVWAQLVPLDSIYSAINLNSDAMIIYSQIKISSNERQEWCMITRETDQIPTLIQNKSSDSIIVDGLIIQKDYTTIIKCGSVIIPGPVPEGFMRYMFKTALKSEILKKPPVRVNLNPEHAYCSICFQVWHNVVTVSPCLHNFCNGCFSKWLKTCEEKAVSLTCPLCRTAAQSVARNPFLHSIEQDIVESVSSLRHSNEETADLDSCSLVTSPIIQFSGYAREMETWMNDHMAAQQRQEDQIRRHDMQITEIKQKVEYVQDMIEEMLRITRETGAPPTPWLIALHHNTLVSRGRAPPNVPQVILQGDAPAWMDADGSDGNEEEEEDGNDNDEDNNDDDNDTEEVLLQGDAPASMDADSSDGNEEEEDGNNNDDDNDTEEEVDEEEDNEDDEWVRDEDEDSEEEEDEDSEEEEEEED